MFHCDLLSHDTSSKLIRPHHAEIEGDHEDYTIVFIANVKIYNRTRRRRLYLQFLTHFVSFDITEWLLLEQVDDCE